MGTASDAGSAGQTRGRGEGGTGFFVAGGSMVNTIILTSDELN